jgi:hypothetical protein
MKNTLKRFWFVFELLGRPNALNIGCGVSAYDYDDATNILRERVFVGQQLPSIRSFVEDVDVSTLDPRHVVPNVGSVTTRGVWFPQGY